MCNEQGEIKIPKHKDISTILYTCPFECVPIQFDYNSISISVSFNPSVCSQHSVGNLYTVSCFILVYLWMLSLGFMKHLLLPIKTEMAVWRAYVESMCGIAVTQQIFKREQVAEKNNVNSKEQEPPSPKMKSFVLWNKEIVTKKMFGFYIVLYSAFLFSTFPLSCRMW